MYIESKWTKKFTLSDDSEKLDSVDNKVQDKTDDTISSNKLPNAGVSKTVVFIIATIVIISIVFFKRYKYYNI